MEYLIAGSAPVHRPPATSTRESAARRSLPRCASTTIHASRTHSTRPPRRRPIEGRTRAHTVAIE